MTGPRLTPEQIAEIRAHLNKQRALEADTMTDQTSKRGGSGLLYGLALFMIFTTLQLTHTVSWSWWLVTAPLWVPFANILTLVVIGATWGAVRTVFKPAT